MQITIHNIGSYALKNYLLETPEGIIAIDTGYPGGAQKFIKRFTKKWPLSQLRYIFLTHHHDDHSGFLADLLQVCDAKVVLHPLTAELLKGGKSVDAPTGGYSSRPAWLFSLIKSEFSFPSVNVATRALLFEGDTTQPFIEMGLPLQIVHLPGHTADSIGLFLTETGALFCGDAAMNAVISVARHTIWIDDAAAFGASWDKMLALRPACIYPSHGTPFPPQDLVKYRHYLDGRPLLPPFQKS